jgi:hypothetical protein
VLFSREAVTPAASGVLFVVWTDTVSVLQLGGSAR